MKFKILSREKIEQYNVSEPHIVISFRDPDLEKAKLPENDSRLDTLYLACGDVGDKGIKYSPFNEEMAKDVWDFIFKHFKDIEMIIVNCEAGISRSSGATAAISKTLEGTDEFVFNHPMLRPNMFIYRTLLNEGMERKSL